MFSIALQNELQKKIAQNMQIKIGDKKTVYQITYKLDGCNSLGLTILRHGALS